MGPHHPFWMAAGPRACLSRCSRACGWNCSYSQKVWGFISTWLYLNTNIKRFLFIIFQTLTPIISTWVLSQQLVLTTTNNVWLSWQKRGYVGYHKLKSWSNRQKLHDTRLSKMRKQKRQVRQTSVSRIKSLTPKRIKGRPAYLVLQSSKIKRNSRHQLGVVQSFKTTTLIPMVSSFTFPIQNIQNATYWGQISWIYPLFSNRPISTYIFWLVVDLPLW